MTDTLQAAGDRGRARSALGAWEPAGRGQGGWKLPPVPKGRAPEPHWLFSGTALPTTEPDRDEKRRLQTSRRCASPGSAQPPAISRRGAGTQGIHFPRSAAQFWGVLPRPRRPWAPKTAARAPPWEVGRKVRPPTPVPPTRRPDSSGQSWPCPVAPPARLAVPICRRLTHPQGHPLPPSLHLTGYGSANSLLRAPCTGPKAGSSPHVKFFRAPHL